MLGKSGGFAGGTIFIHSIAAQCNARQTVPFSQFAHQIEPAPIGKPEIANYQIEFTVVSELFGCGETIRVTHVVTTSFQQAQQYLARCRCDLRPEGFGPAMGSSSRRGHNIPGHRAAMFP